MDSEQMQNADNLRRKIARYREIAKELMNDQAAANIAAMTDGLEEQLRTIERRG